MILSKLQNKKGSYSPRRSLPDHIKKYAARRSFDDEENLHTNKQRYQSKELIKDDESAQSVIVETRIVHLEEKEEPYESHNPSPIKYGLSMRDRSPQSFDISKLFEFNHLGGKEYSKGHRTSKVNYEYAGSDADSLCRASEEQITLKEYEQMKEKLYETLTDKGKRVLRERELKEQV